MVKVEMPRADWELCLIVMEKYDKDFGGVLIKHLIKEISDQVYSQEY